MIQPSYDDMEAWEEDLLRRYPEPAAASGQAATGKAAADLAAPDMAAPDMAAPDMAAVESIEDESTFRDYEAEARSSVREFYRLNHCNQSFDFVRQKRAQYLPLKKAEMSIWEAMEFLNELVDDSDPDLELPQIEHLLQTAEAIRSDGHPQWFILTGLIHDLGKILCLWDEPQWAVVGDTFPVGCRYSDRIVFAEYFRENPDWRNENYQTENGIYDPHCGLDNLVLSWGHDEYLYHVVKPYLPAPALAMIRYHSCYPIHKEGAYAHLLKEEDQHSLDWVAAFNHYDLYTKRDERMQVTELKPYYENLISEYFPEKIAW
ncbi:MAG: inositol oxygenase family protein [Planctomycetota bacterium]